MRLFARYVVRQYRLSDSLFVANALHIIVDDVRVNSAAGLDGQNTIHQPSNRKGARGQLLLTVIGPFCYAFSHRQAGTEKELSFL